MGTSLDGPARWVCWSITWLRRARAIVVTRVFDAPRTLVFDAWTDARHIGRWYGPQGFSITTHSMDVRPGGSLALHHAWAEWRRLPE